MIKLKWLNLKYVKLLLLTLFISLQFPIISANQNDPTATKLPSLPPNAAHIKGSPNFEQTPFFIKQMEERNRNILNGGKQTGSLKFASTMAEFERAIRIIGYFIAFAFFVYYLASIRKLLDKGETHINGVSLSVSIVVIVLLMNLNSAIMTVSNTFISDMTCASGEWASCIQSTTSLLGLENYLEPDSVILQERFVSNAKNMLIALTSIGVISFVFSLIKIISAGNKRDGYSAILNFQFFAMFTASILLMNINDTLTRLIKLVHDVGSGF